MRRAFGVALNIIGRFWAIGFAACTIYGVFQAWILHYRSLCAGPCTVSPISWPVAFRDELLLTYIAGVLSPAVIRMASTFRLEGSHLLRNVAVHIAGTFCYATIIKWLYDLYDSVGIGRTVSLSPADALQNGVLLYWLIVAAYYASDYHQRYREGLAQAADLRTQLADAQSHALKMQLPPHFLFNTLQSIAELVHQNADTAENMILALSRFLRLSLETSGAIEVPLEQELQFARSYLAIEEMRFENRLRVDLQVDPDLRVAVVPNLIVQPLLENAIKHGIARHDKQGYICLSVKRDGNFVLIAISDNGAGLDWNSHLPLREGVGLRTTRARLGKLYGTNQSFHFVRRTGFGAEAVIRLPLRWQNSTPIYEHASDSDRGR